MLSNILYNSLGFFIAYLQISTSGRVYNYKLDS